MDGLRFLRTALLLLAGLPMALSAVAGPTCFLLAENYYEQLYCEVKAKGEGGSLPSLRDFRNNNQMTQALLLKRPTGRLGIALAMPNMSGGVSQAKVSPPERPAAVVPSMSDCRLAGATIQCDGNRFQLTGNLSNRHINEASLEAGNQLLLPRYNGAGNADLQRYLAEAYRLYLRKMLEIGLGGSTMTYAKFHYLYFDLTDKGADFVARSKTVFDYLKADKKRLAVSEAVSPAAGLTLSDCDRVAEHLIACGHGNKNYLYLASQ